MKNTQVTAWVVAAISFASVTYNTSILDGALAAALNGGLAMLVGTGIVKVWRRQHPVSTKPTEPMLTPSWHKDPKDPNRLRYWDGRQWTNAYALQVNAEWVTHLWEDGEWKLVERSTSLPVPTAPSEKHPIPDAESTSDVVADAEVANIAQALRQLKGLHVEGILTDEEYEAKRKRLAEQL